jgi:hypothetical protein
MLLALLMMGLGCTPTETLQPNPLPIAEKAKETPKERCTDEKAGIYKYRDKRGNTYFTDCRIEGSNFTLEWSRERRRFSKKETRGSTFKKVQLTANQVAKVKQRVGDQLKDPYSARYHSIQGVAIKTGSNETTVVCGLVNAKNAFGGYVGKRPFIGSFNPRNGFSVAGMGTDAADSQSIVSKCRSFGMRFDL